MNDFTKLDRKITHVNLTKIKIKIIINYINLMKFPSFPVEVIQHSPMLLCAFTTTSFKSILLLLIII